MVSKFLLNQAIKLISKRPEIRDKRETARKLIVQTGNFNVGSKSKPAFKLLLLGDSIAAGTGIKTFDKSVGGLIAKEIASRGKFVICQNNAKIGSRIEHIESQIPSGEWNLAILITASNDVLWSNPPKFFEKNLGGVLEELTKHSKKIIVAGPGDIASILFVPIFAKPFLTWRQKRFAKVAEKTAHHFPRVEYANPLLWKNSPENFDTDGFHPSEKGHIVWFEIIRPYL